MKKNLSKALLALLIVVLSVAYLPGTGMGGMLSIKASAATYSGKLGSNVSWSYNTSNKTITVSGSGAMNNYTSAKNGQGWDSYRPAIVTTIQNHATKIVINSGITTIGNNAFRGLSKVTSVSIPDTVTTIGQSAFEDCSALSSVNLHERITSIGPYAFKKTSFKSVTMPYSVTTIGTAAFDNISGLNITCNYGDPAYTYCTANGKAYSLRALATAIDVTPDSAARVVRVSLKLKNASGLNAGNFTLNYDSSVLTPVSTATAYTDSASFTSTTVFNSAGKISVAVMSSSQVPYADCASGCELTIATVDFRVTGQNDTAAFSAATTVAMRCGTRGTATASSGTFNLHNYVVTASTAATCTRAGERTLTCGVCNKFYTEAIAIDSSNHTGGTRSEGAHEATCTESGHTGNTICTDCGAVITAGGTIPATGHAYGAWSIISEATCTENGEQTRTCSVCGEIETVAIAATGAHTYGQWEVATAAVCGQDGEQSRVCSVCGHEDTQTIAAPGDEHRFDEWLTTTSPTCGAEGVETRYCTICGDTETRAIAATGYHTYGEWTVQTAAGCTTSGTDARICIICGETETRRVSPVGHNFVDGECTRCHETSVAAITFTADSGLTADEESKTVLSKTTLTVTELLAKIATTGWTVTDTDGNAVTGDDAVGTGYILSHSSGLSYTMVIMGDTNSDGKVTAADARIALRISARLETGTAAQRLAGDINGDANVTASDARTILRVSAKLQRFE